MATRKDKKLSNEVEDALQRRDIEELTKEVREGFAGVHERQNVTNGKVLKATDDIINLKNDMSFYKGGLAVLTILVVPVLIYIITHWQ